MNNTAICYKFYNEKGQRLAIFSRFINETQAEIFILPCSKNELFYKQYAKNVYALYLTGKDLVADLNIKSHSVILVDIVPEDGTLKTLFRYAYNNLYFKFVKQVCKTVEILKPIKNVSK